MVCALVAPVARTQGIAVQLFVQSRTWCVRHSVRIIRGYHHVNNAELECYFSSPKIELLSKVSLCAWCVGFDLPDNTQRQEYQVVKDGEVHGCAHSCHGSC